MTTELEPLVWHTEQRTVNQLVPYEHNPRKMTEKQVAALTDSLKKFGLAEIPAINVDNTLVAGHQRTKVMQMLGRGDEVIDVRVPNRPLTESEFKEYLVRSNQNRGMFDFDILPQLFSQEELLLIGFTERELDMVEFPELNEDDLSEQVPNDMNYKYDVVFFEEKDFDSFTVMLNEIHKVQNQPTKSLSLLKHMQETV